MKNKAYNPNWKKKFDGVGKTISEEIMRDCFGAEHICDNAKEDRGDFSDGFWDQAYSWNGQTLIVEPEIKVGVNGSYFGDHWKSRNEWRWPFKWPTVDIPYRKVKNKSNLHLVIGDCKKFAALVTRKSMDDCIEQNGGNPYIKVTKQEPEGAPYYCVPLGRCRFVKKLSTGKWIFTGRKR